MGVCVLPVCWEMLLVAPYCEHQHGITCRSLKLMKLGFWPLVVTRAQGFPHSQKGLHLISWWLCWSSAVLIMMPPHFSSQPCKSSGPWLLYVTSVSKSLTSHTVKDSEGAIPAPILCLSVMWQFLISIRCPGWMMGRQPRGWSAGIPNGKVKNFTPHSAYLYILIWISSQKQIFECTYLGGDLWKHQ